MKVKLKNGQIGELVKDVHIIFNEGDRYSYTVPSDDILGLVESEEDIKKDDIIYNMAYEIIDIILSNNTDRKKPAISYCKYKSNDIDNCTKFSCLDCI